MNPLIPYSAFTQFTSALPQFYWNVYSSEQRIKHICHELHKLAKYDDYLRKAIDALAENVSDDLANLSAEIRNSQDKLRIELLDILENLQEGTLQWDVQAGEYTDTVTAQRDMFNDVTVHSYNIEQLDKIFDELDMNVEKLADCGLNVKGFAVLNHYLLTPNMPTDDTTYNEKGKKNDLTVNALTNVEIDLDGYLYTPKEG